MKSSLTAASDFSRRDFIRTCALGTAALASGSVLGVFGPPRARSSRIGAFFWISTGS
jgi:hypothetical protein